MAKLFKAALERAVEHIKMGGDKVGGKTYGPEVVGPYNIMRAVRIAFEEVT